MQGCDLANLHTPNETQDQRPLAGLRFAGLSTLIQKLSTEFSARATDWLHRLDDM
jgi:hypothetical protein